jgi:tRNA pseudouridine55 synthase
MQIDLENGSVLLINKPLEWTSFDAVNKLKYAIIKANRTFFNPPGERKRNLKIGHAGTLDPLATGLLIICAGKKTKSINEYMGLEKEYTGTFFIGATRPSYDKETAIDKEFETGHITQGMIYDAAHSFTGEQMQVPPAFSAIKKDGVRAYKNARQGGEVKLEARSIFIREFEITGIRMPLVDFRIVCSKGTYIRSIASDFGRALQSGAYLDALCRTKIGAFELKDAMSIDDFINSQVQHESTP